MEAPYRIPLYDNDIVKKTAKSEARVTSYIIIPYGLTPFPVQP
jgi:hypothetical protein